MNKLQLILILLSSFLYLNRIMAQAPGDYRSTQSGNWNTAANWQIYSTSAGWSTTQSKPGSSRNVTIQKDHTITLDGSNSCNNLTIEEGGTLNSAVDSKDEAYYLRVGGNANSNAVIQNDGLLGSTTTTGDGIILEATANAASLIIRGTGVCQVARLRAISGNTRNFTLEIDQDINLTVSGNPAFTAYYNNSSSSSNDNYTFTINTGKTVKLLSETGYFHMSGTSTSNSGGNYIYNINGTLDLSNTTVSANVVPLSTNAASTVTLNVAGQLKLGAGFNMINSSPSANNNGKVYIYVNNGGVVDAGNTSTLNLGDNYFKLSGNGVLKRTVGNSDVIFPVGLASATEPNFVTLKNSGTETTFAVGLSSSFQAPPSSLKLINREWKVVPGKTGAIVDMSLNFGSAEQSADFKTTDDVSLIHYTGNLWNEEHAELSVISPNLYSVQASGVNSFGAFSIQNSTTLPLDVTSFTARLEKAALSPQAVLQWTTQNEVNTDKFIIERSSDGKSFSFITSMSAKNITGIHNYIFKDTSPLSGISYYRLTQRDKDGKETFNGITSIENSTDQFRLFPNPVANILNITHLPSGKGDLIKIVNSNGALVSSITPVGNSTSTEIDLTSFTPGFYSIVFQKENSLSAFKFIKK